MRVHALLSWFDEDPGMLYEAVASHCEHCDTLTALDGRYALYPALRTESSGEEYDAIADAARDTGTPFLIEAPAGPWDGPHGGEVAKRAHLFRLAEQRSQPADWCWIFDGDFVVRDAFGDWRSVLEQTDRLSADVELVEHRRRIPHPVLFRALRGLTVSDVHWRYHVPDGPELWGPLAGRPEPLGEHVVVEHRDMDRGVGRRMQRRRYYRHRDRTGLERLPPDVEAVRERLAAEHRSRMDELLAAIAGG